MKPIDIMTMTLNKHLKNEGISTFVFFYNFNQLLNAKYSMVT